MYFVVAGGGEVGFHLAKALLESGHEVMVIESDRRRAQFIEEQLGSVVLHAPADEGRYQMEAGCQRADAMISSTRVLMNVIEQELPSPSGFLPLMPLTGSHLELIEAEIGPNTPGAGKSLRSLGLPDGTAVGGIVRKGSVLHADGDVRLEV